MERLMDSLTQSDCFHPAANEARRLPSFTEGCNANSRSFRRSLRGTACLNSLLIFVGAVFFSAGCGQEAAPPTPVAAAKPAEPAVPEDVQAAADSLLGKETTVLLFGDLAKTGKQQLLAANVVPKSTKNNLPGTIVTRTVVAENQDGKWAEIFRGDEHLKNSRGFLAGTPLAGVNGWRLAFEQDPEKGLALYFTPLKGTNAAEAHVLPIGVRWNPETRRYQSLDRSYEHFLLESPSMDTARSTLR
jgi:hypothetical protein